MLWFERPAFPEEPNELETCHPASPRVQILDLLLDLGIKSEKRARAIVRGSIGSLPGGVRGKEATGR